MSAGAASDEAPSPGPRETDPSPPTPLRRGLRIALRVAGAALLAAVLWKVPWRDRVHMADGSVRTGRLASEWFPGAAVRLDEGSGVVGRPDGAGLNSEGCIGMADWVYLLSLAGASLRFMTACLRESKTERVRRSDSIWL